MVALRRFEVLALLAVCVFLVVFQAISHEVGFYGAETDLYLYYARTAEALHHGEIWIDDFHPPLFGWLLGLLTFLPIFPGAFEAGIFLSVLSYFAIILATFLLAKECCGQNDLLAAVAALLVASNPALADQGCRAVVHVFYLALSLWAIYFVLKQKPVWAGLLVALALWTRAVWILSLIPLLFLRGKQAMWGWAIAAVAWIGLGLFTQSYHGTWFYSTNKLSFAAGLYNTEMPDNPGRWDQLHQAQFINMSLPDIALYNPSKALKTVGDHFLTYGFRILTKVLVLPLGLIAIFGLRKRFWALRRSPLITWTAASFVLLIISFWGPQYIVGFVPLLSIAAAAQLVHFPYGRYRKVVPRLLIYGTCIAGLVILLGTFIEGPDGVKQASLALKKLPGEHVLARDPRVFYYSHKKPGSLRLTAKGEAILDAEYIFGSDYEMSVNDTLRYLIRRPDFRSRFEVRDYYTAFFLCPRVVDGVVASGAN